jgi:hypothetical protein
MPEQDTSKAGLAHEVSGGIQPHHNAANNYIYTEDVEQFNKPVHD